MDAARLDALEMGLNVFLLSKVVSSVASVESLGDGGVLFRKEGG